MRKISLLVLTFVLFALLGWANPSLTHAQTKVFTLEELKQYDGQAGRPAYYAYEGKVYDVTGSKLWENGQHYGLQAGEDLTGKMTGAPHGTEVFAGFKVVGTYGQTPAVAASPTTTSVAPPVVTETASQPWYAGRIKLLGFSILGWTGILLAVFFVLTFGTCFAMPWAKLPLPWKGKRIGPDPLDQAGTHLTWSSIHKYFVWVTVIAGLIHGILGLMQMLWGIYL